MDELGKLLLVHAIFEGLRDLRKLIFNSKKENRAKIAAAISAIQLAIIESKNFVQNEGYQTNAELVRLWQQAFQKTAEAKIDDQNLLDALYHKASFWGTPQEWLASPHTLELVPKFIDLSEQCQMLLIEMKK